MLGGEVRRRIVAEGRGDARTRLLLQRPGGGQVAERLARRWPASVTEYSGRLPFQLNLLLDGKDSRLQIDSGSQGAPSSTCRHAVRQDGRPGAADPMADDPGWRQNSVYWARYDGLASLAYAAPADKPLNGRGALRAWAVTRRCCPPSAQGLQVRRRLAELDWDAWQATLKLTTAMATRLPVALRACCAAPTLRIDGFKGFGRAEEPDAVTIWPAGRGPAATGAGQRPRIGASGLAGCQGARRSWSIWTA
ncbi:hypothetical protein ACPA9J_29455 [Pseudomonas aeruginosa]